MTKPISAAEVRALLPKSGKRSKYGAKKHTVDGVTFDSIAEANRFCVLRLMEKQGEIEKLERQPEFMITLNGKQLVYPNGRKARMRLDFRYFDKRRNCDVIEDVKSRATRTEAYALRKLIVEALYDVRIEEVG